MNITKTELKFQVLLLSFLGIIILLTGCGSSSSNSGSGGGSTAIALPANHMGVLLEGDPADRAVDALVTMLPSPVDVIEIVDGLMTTRLEALVDHEASVDDINQALTDSQARIVSMSEGFPVVTLVVPTMSNASAANAKADELEATPAFSLVTASYLSSAVTQIAAARVASLSTSTN